MSDPIRINQSQRLSTQIQSIMCEVASAESALYMDPDPVENPPANYLADSDKWVKHSVIHLKAVFADLAKIIVRLERAGL